MVYYWRKLGPSGHRGLLENVFLMSNKLTEIWKTPWFPSKMIHARGILQILYRWEPLLNLREGSSSMRPWSFDAGVLEVPEEITADLEKSYECIRDRGMSGDHQLGNMKSFFHQLETKPFKRWRLFGGPWVTDYEEFGADFAAARTQSRAKAKSSTFCLEMRPPKSKGYSWLFHESG